MAAKGRTNQPLVIDVHSPWFAHPAVTALVEAGHRVRRYGYSDGTSNDPDWIMHPAAGWHEAFFAQNDKGEFPFVEARLKGERARKRGKR